MPRKSLVDVIWEFRMSKQIQISTGNLIPDSKQIQPKADGCFCLNVI